MENQLITIRDHFLAALERDGFDAQLQYLAEHCSEMPEMRAQLEDMLRAHHEPEGFLTAESNDPPTIDQPFTERPGDSIGPYKLLQQIGEGGMGVVYMAEQTKPVERRVALKIIKPGMDTRQVIARFEAERQALAMMDHPNIAKVLDAGTTDSGRPYFVMELVKGVPVTQYCDKKQLTPSQRLELFVPICLAVQHAHQKGIIHRDIKPSNVLVAQYDDRPVPKIIDFGVAKAIEQRLTERTLFTEFGQVVGTPEYMSPEQAQLNHLDIDTRTDVYSLGVLLYELLSGETPFDRQRLRSAAFDELLRIIREEEPPRPSAKLSTSESLPTIAANRHIEPNKLSTLVHGELDWIVMKALEKDRTRRYETASKFAEDVEHYLNGEAVAACPPSRAYRFRKFARRNKAVIAMTTATGTLLLLGIVGTSWQAIRATHERNRAIAAEERAQQEAEHAETEAAITKAVNDFLQQDLLGMADAAQQVEAQMSPNPEIQVRTLLDRASQRIEERFDELPRVQAAIYYTIGNAYRSIGDYEKAYKLLQESLKIRRLTLGIEHPDTLDSMHCLAKVHYARGCYKEAEALNRKTLEIRRRTLGEGHTSTACSIQALGDIRMVQRRDEEAESLHNQALDIFRRTLGEEHRLTIECLRHLANNYKWQGRFEEAEALLGQAIESYRRTLGDEHPRTLYAMIVLVNTYNYQSRYQDAEALSRQTLEILSRTLGDDHPFTLSCKSQLAWSWYGQGRDDEAGMLFLRLLEPTRRNFGAAHPYTIDNFADASWYLATATDPAQRDPIQAIELAKWATKQRPDKQEYWGILGVALYRNSDFSEAIEALEKARELQGGTDPEHQFFLAMAYWQAGQRDEALKNYKEALAWLESGDRYQRYHRFKAEAEALINPNDRIDTQSDLAIIQERSNE